MNEKHFKTENISIPDSFRQELNENEYDLKAYNKAMEEFKADPVTYSHEEVGKILNLI